MKYRLLIIDGNYLAWLAWSKAEKDVKDPINGKRSILSYFVQDYLTRLKEITTRFPHHFCAIAWDHPRGSLLRKKWLASYKARPPKPDGFNAAIGKLKIGLDRMDLFQVDSEMGEGDDVIASLCKKFKGCLIWSVDKDFFQIIDKYTHQYRYHNNTLVTISNIEQVAVDHGITGLDPEQWHNYLILAGDSSDKIPGMKGIGSKRAKIILTTIGDFVDMVCSDDPQEHKDLVAIAEGHGKQITKWAKQALEERANILLAKKLVSLYILPIELKAPVPSKELFWIFLKKLGIEHLTEDLYYGRS
jgi:5'-3' exonuclease